MLLVRILTPNFPWALDETATWGKARISLYVPLAGGNNILINQNMS